MKTVTSVEQMRSLARRWNRSRKKIALVPTMGALHRGHLALVKQARKYSDLVVVSIFVNPRQFGPNEDFNKYPRTPDADERLLTAAGADYLFLPPVAEMFPDNYETEVSVRELSRILCGRGRPGHFTGVVTVVLKFFNIVQPEVALFGEKDYQQLMVIKKMVQDLNLSVKIIPVKTIREKSGLALSSRNAYLTPAQKISAAVLFKALQKAAQMIKGGTTSSPKIVMAMNDLILRAGGQVEYVAILDPRTLQEVRQIKKKVRIMLAVRLAGVRLIDNVLV